MTDVIDQLRLLGEAAETYVEPVTAAEAVHGPSPRRWGRSPKPRGWLMAAAAVGVLIAAGAGAVRLVDDDRSGGI